MGSYLRGASEGMQWVDAGLHFVLVQAVEVILLLNRPFLGAGHLLTLSGQYRLCKMKVLGHVDSTLRGLHPNAEVHCVGIVISSRLWTF